MVRMTTSAGNIDIALYTEDCPETSGNFLKLVDDEFYNGLHFHRVIKNFMIQGGCPRSKDPFDGRAGTGGPGWKIPCETSALTKKHDRPGLFSMANAGPNTGGSQFFLTTVPTPWLDGNHAIFGGLFLVWRMCIELRIAIQSPEIGRSILRKSSPSID